jgi:hypothetical protein
MVMISSFGIPGHCFGVYAVIGMGDLLNIMPGVGGGL